MIALAAAALLVAATAPNPALAPLPALYPSLEATYQELHRAPELSLQEAKTVESLINAIAEHIQKERETQ